MKIDIWSDVRCPFCYIGKHKFEKALDQFEHKDAVRVNWHSFELNPDLETDPDVNALDHLAQSKGISREQVDQMTGHVERAANEVGLIIDSENSAVANSFNAHKLIQFAQEKGLGNEVEEALFRAHFVGGLNIDDKTILLQIGETLELDKQELEDALSSDEYAGKVKSDETKARSLGISGVPFFVFNDKYAVSGAQPPNVFLDVLEQSWEEFEKEKGPIVVNDGASCDVDGNCE